jgi:hypothetical protein
METKTRTGHWAEPRSRAERKARLGKDACAKMDAGRRYTAHVEGRTTTEHRAGTHGAGRATDAHAELGD